MGKLLIIAAACLLVPLPARSAGGAGNCLAEGSALYRSGRLTAAAGVFAAGACVSSTGLKAHLNAAVLYKDLGLTDKALDGRDFRRILSHYYPGTSLKALGY
ncbi:MAG: hypothetical protein COT18_03115 [Elusimicrobia bacterium CG08_land_8_20_14_0_20_59_10]|nr:MAG: hypothetical protein COT18_03115 [Elusimicrobia bacterium CG08_land_8_20_14_0_20_59_10]